MKRKWTDKQLVDAVQTSKSLSDVCRLLGIKPIGGNLMTVRLNSHRLGLSLKHFTGQAWNKDKTLKILSLYRSNEHIKRKLLETRDYVCETCGIFNWNNSNLTLELDHINGNSTDNNSDNLRLLCPNCHSQTPTFRNKKRG